MMAAHGGWKMIDIEKEVDNARYSEVLQMLLTELGGVRLLRKDYESDYQGHVDVDVLLNDGRVFTYYYSYGSCSGCDEWEDRGLSDDQIKDTMKTEATFYPDEASYNEWRRMANK